MLDSLKWQWMALVGATMGALFIPTYLATTLGLSVVLAFPSGLLPLSGALTLAGAGLASGLTIAAQRAQRRELRVVEEVAAFAEGRS